MLNGSVGCESDKATPMPKTLIARVSITVSMAMLCALTASAAGRTEPAPGHHPADHHSPATSVQPKDTVQATTSCMYRTWGWTASIVPSPRWTNGTLIVLGKIATPEACYKVRLNRGGLTQSQAPSQYFALDVERAAGLCPQTSREFTVSAQIPAQPRYDSVIVLCSGSKIAEINQINRVPTPKPEIAR
jgi:hypothetical protein